MTRDDLFRAIRPFAPEGKFTDADVKAIDALADRFRLSGAAQPSGPQTMTPSPAAIKLMHEFEGCKLAAYPDPGSKDGNPWTIGWGSTGPGIVKGVTWSQEQVDVRFAHDLAKFSEKVAAILGNATTTQAQFDALVSFAYNVGTGALAGSTLLKMHKAGDYRGARGQFGRWTKNDGKEMAGLVRRRAAEAALYGS